MHVDMYAFYELTGFVWQYWASWKRWVPDIMHHIAFVYEIWFVYMYIYVCVLFSLYRIDKLASYQQHQHLIASYCLCLWNVVVCVCVRERERERDSMCVCVCAVWIITEWFFDYICIVLPGCCCQNQILRGECGGRESSSPGNQV